MSTEAEQQSISIVGKTAPERVRMMGALDETGKAVIPKTKDGMLKVSGSESQVGLSNSLLYQILQELELANHHLSLLTESEVQIGES